MAKKPKRKTTLTAGLLRLEIDVIVNGERWTVDLVRRLKDGDPKPIWLFDDVRDEKGAEPEGKRASTRAARAVAVARDLLVMACAAGELGGL